FFFDVSFDFVAHELRVGTTRTHERLTMPLRDGLSVAEFYETLKAMLGEMGVGMKIWTKPYGVPLTTPFDMDTEHHSYDRVAVRRWFDVLLWSTGVMDRFAGRFHGKESVPQLFWHSFDLALTRFSGRKSSAPVPADPVAREAYSQECISFGF